MKESDLLKLEAKMHNPRYSNAAGQQAAISVSPQDLSDLIAVNRSYNALMQEQKEGTDG